MGNFNDICVAEVHPKEIKPDLSFHVVFEQVAPVEHGFNSYLLAATRSEHMLQMLTIETVREVMEAPHSPQEVLHCRPFFVGDFKVLPDIGHQLSVVPVVLFEASSQGVPIAILSPRQQPQKPKSISDYLLASVTRNHFPLLVAKIVMTPC